MIKCEVCKREFEKPNKRGRPPKICPSCKEKRDAIQEENRKTREMVSSDTSLTSVPVFTQAGDISEIEVGDVVYSLPSYTDNELSQRRFARDYKVLSIEGQNVEVVRNLKQGYANYPAKVHFSRLFRKTGVEYLDIGQDNAIMETEGIDD